MYKRFLFASSAIVALTAAQAHAATQAPIPNWYVGLSGGITYMDHSDIGGVEMGKVNYSNGYIGTIALGYVPDVTFQPLSNMRFEVELGYHSNLLNAAFVSPGPATPAGGDVHSVTYMGNAYYDFTNPSGFTPYVGTGLGMATVHLSHTSNAGNMSSSSSNVFAYQFMGGVSYAPPQLPKTELTLGYRYLDETDPNFNSAAGKIKLEDVSSHNLEVGGRFHF